MKLSQEQIDSILQSSLPDVVKSVEVEMKELVINQIRYSSSEVISNYIKEWVTENILPEIEKTLVESKPGLIGLALKMAEDTMTILAESHAEGLKKRLESSWERGKILKAIFGE